jgi:large subunit ribosomal protein L9
MRLILTTDVKGRGKEGDVIEVARGFAVNYLLPRKMALEATPGNLKQLEARMHNIRKREEVRHGEAEQVAAAITGRTLVIAAKAGESGKLFGSVTGGQVAEAIGAQLGVDVDRKKLDLHGQIKTIGDHEIDLHLYADVTAPLVVRVVPEGGVLQAEPQEVEPIAEALAAADELDALEAAEEALEADADAPVEEAAADAAEDFEAADEI